MRELFLISRDIIGRARRLSSTSDPQIDKYKSGLRDPDES